MRVASYSGGMRQAASSSLRGRLAGPFALARSTRGATSVKVSCDRDRRKPRIQGAGSGGIRCRCCCRS